MIVVALTTVVVNYSLRLHFCRTGTDFATSALVRPDDNRYSMIVVALTTVVVNYSLLVQASRIFVIFIMLAAVVRRIHTTRTNGTSITRFANIRAAAGQNARI